MTTSTGLTDVRFVFGFESGPKDRPRRELVVA
jgi:hypothetical protein